MARNLRIAGGTLPLGERPCIMGILNVTPDSFYDGGRHDSPERALFQARRMESEGADIIDVGGESTRPGAETVSPDLEARRVVPVIDALRGEIRVPLSVDTCHEEVAREALRAGASIINDVTGLGDSPGMASLAAETGAGVIIMHMQGAPGEMQRDPHYEDVVGEVIQFLRERALLAREAGVREEAIVVDPGIGFGKRLQHNLDLLNRIGELRALGYPVLVGPSRKSFIREITGAEVDERLPGTAAAVALAVAAGVEIVRVHDVREMREVADVAWEIGRRGGEEVGSAG